MFMLISLQQIIALLIIFFFISRLIGQKKKQAVSGNEFALWLFFWIFSALAILFLKDLDRLTAGLGFSASGINLLFYAAILILFYLIFKMRLRLAKMDQDITDLTRTITLQRELQNKK